MNIQYRWLVILFLYGGAHLGLGLQATVKSSSPAIDFDAQNDQSIEMSLSASGLRVLAPQADVALTVAGQALVQKHLSVGSDAVAVSDGNTRVGFHNAGVMSLGIQVMSASDNLADVPVVMADASAANIELCLPDASIWEGRTVQVKKTSKSHEVLIYGDPIEGLPVLALPSSDMRSSVQLISSGNAWWVLNQAGSAFESRSGNVAAWWPFDDRSGSVISQGYDTTSALDLSANFSIEAQVVDGVRTKALSFDGQSNELSLADPADGSLDMKSGDWSVSVWLKRQGTPVDAMICCKRGGDNATDGYSVLVDSLGRVQAYMNKSGVGNQGVTGVSSIDDGSWHHVAIVFDRSSLLSVYVDGVLDATQDISTIQGNLDSAHSFQVGNWWDRRFEGAMDDLKVYNKALSLQDIKREFSRR